jgi:hypothetical protein
MFTSVPEMSISVTNRVGEKGKEAEQERGRQKRLNKRGIRRY